MPMYDPPHPGDLVRYECLEPLGLTVERAAQGLGVTPQELLDLIDGRASVSVEMSFRLSKAFGSSPEVWVGMQIAHDRWQMEKGAKRIEVENFWPSDPTPTLESGDSPPAAHSPTSASSIPTTTATSPTHR